MVPGRKFWSKPCNGGPCAESAPDALAAERAPKPLLPTVSRGCPCTRGTVGERSRTDRATEGMREMALIAKAASERNIQNRTIGVLQQALCLRNTPTAEIVGWRHAHVLPKHAREMDRMHIGGTRRFGYGGLPTQRVVEVFAYRSHPWRRCTG